MITFEDIISKKEKNTTWQTPVVSIYKGHHSIPNLISNNESIDRLNGRIDNQLVYHDSVSEHSSKNNIPNSDWIECLMGLNLHDTLIEKEWLEK